MLSDKSGQMMLVNAFLLAIAVVAITLMLNNVIYSSNVAYEGFMDQSRYDDLSYKVSMADEAAYAYTNDSGNYAEHLNDFEQSMNNLMLLKSRYISVLPQYSGIPCGDNTWTRLYIYGKESSSSYDIYTRTPASYDYGNPNGDVVPASITLSASKKTLVSNGTDRVLLTVTVIDNQSNPLPDTIVHVTFNRTDTSSLMGLDGSSFSGGGTTNFLGQLQVYLTDIGQNDTGDEILYAYTNTTNSTMWSIPVLITCISPNPPMSGYDIPAPAVSVIPTEQAPVTVSFDFTGFNSSNVYIFGNESYDNLVMFGTGPAYNPVTHNITFTVKRSDDYGWGNMTMWVRVIGNSTIDHLPLDKVKAVNISVQPMSSGSIPHTVSLSGVNDSNNKVDAAIAFDFAGFNNGNVQILNNAMYGTTFNNTAYTNNNDAAFNPATDTVTFQASRNDKSRPGSVTLWCEVSAVDATGLYYDRIEQITVNIPPPS